MDLPEPLSNEQLSVLLPKRDPDEPKSLRADIIDEVRDHLLQSLQKELLSNGDEIAAQQRVIDNFGNPAATVRRLWFSEMRSRLMIRNVTLATSILALIAGLAAVWMVRGLAVEFRDSAAATRELMAASDSANRELLAESRKQNQLVVEQLTELAKRPSESARSAIWNPLKFKLESDEAGGKPAVGFTVEISGKLHTESTDVSMGRISGDNGEVDFGLVRPGNVEFTITSPWQTQRRGAFDVYPNKDHVEAVICPGSAPEEKSVDLQIDWPEFLKGRTDAVLVFEINEGTASRISNRSWRSQRELVVLAYPDGKFQIAEGGVYMDAARPVSRQQVEEGLVSTVNCYTQQTMENGLIGIRTQEFQVSSFGFLDRTKLVSKKPTEEQGYFHTAAPLLAPDPVYNRTLSLLFTSGRSPHMYSGSRPIGTETLSFSRASSNEPIKLTIPERVRFEALARYSLRDMELDVSTTTLAAAVEFFRLDVDNNGELTEEEASSGQLSSLKIKSRQPDYPCSLSALIEHNRRIRTRS